MTGEQTHTISYWNHDELRKLLDHDWPPTRVKGVYRGVHPYGHVIDPPARAKALTEADMTDRKKGRPVISVEGDYRAEELSLLRKENRELKRGR